MVQERDLADVTLLLHLIYQFKFGTTLYENYSFHSIPEKFSWNERIKFINLTIVQSAFKRIFGGHCHHLVTKYILVYNSCNLGRHKRTKFHTSLHLQDFPWKNSIPRQGFCIAVFLHFWSKLTHHSPSQRVGGFKEFCGRRSGPYAAFATLPLEKGLKVLVFAGSPTNAQGSQVTICGVWNFNGRHWALSAPKRISGVFPSKQLPFGPDGWTPGAPAGLHVKVNPAHAQILGLLLVVYIK